MRSAGRVRSVTHTSVTERFSSCASVGVGGAIDVLACAGPGGGGSTAKVTAAVSIGKEYGDRPPATHKTHSCRTMCAVSKFANGGNSAHC